MSQYDKSGVSIDRGDQFVDAITGLVAQTRRAEVLADIGGFAGLFALPTSYRKPVLVSSTDGVGTKIILADRYQQWQGIGIDCVAMCVNDIGCFGAEPLFFLDYLAVGKINPTVLKEIVAGMAKACKEVGCALLGGETAEMPGVYPPEKFDVAGFTVGIVEKEEIIDGQTISPGDRVIGVASSGFHSNGFSLIRKVIDENSLHLNMTCAETQLSLIDTLLLPTKLYTPLVLKLKKEVTLKGIAHITGGGLTENLPRILPKGLQIELEKRSWPVPQYMELFREKGGLGPEEFLRVFNAGIGLCFVIGANESEKTIQKIKELGEKAWEIGKVTTSRN